MHVHTLAGELLSPPQHWSLLIPQQLDIQDAIANYTGYTIPPGRKRHAGRLGRFVNSRCQRERLHASDCSTRL